MKKKVRVNDKMQKGYVYYLVEPEGKNFEGDFKPELTPKQILELGVFDGVYMRDCKKEFGDYLKKAKLAKDKRDFNLNYFQISASQSLKVWRENGWINEEHDPRGWFQWYCRYFKGRRIKDYDSWQIKRWKQMKRHIGQIKKNCSPKDLSCRRKQRQALLHWAYDSRKI
jgi:hypothetical protein